ncbi:MAG: restriction endonuclease [Alphaproteobacteria bacterium]|nr:MAG: restriction endonuclease [Alphaproteobacteria bacterium]
MARVWLVRLGKFGEQEARALATGELVTGWDVDDLELATSREAVLSLLEKAYPEEKKGTLQNWSAQLNQLRNIISPGDLVVCPMKTTGQIAIGKVIGGYRHIEDTHPTRVVEWLKPDLPRDAVKQDLLFSMGASQTVCEISRNEAATRVESMALNGFDPGPATALSVLTKASVPVEPLEADQGPIDLAVAARDQIERHIAAHFTGHSFTQLVAAILRAQGYQTRVSPPGADRGIDIVAGQGALGFGGPRLVVQVKSGGVISDQPTLQGLIGCIADTQADQGLLVSWSGFTPPVRSRVNELYFRVRMWGRDEIVSALLSVYDELPETIRAELPLRRIWSLVPADDGS